MYEQLFIQNLIYIKKLNWSSVLFIFSAPPRFGWNYCLFFRFAARIFFVSSKIIFNVPLLARFTDERPQRLIGDKAYDSDPLDEQLARFETELIAPHKANRKRTKTQDGRELRPAPVPLEN